MEIETALNLVTDLREVILEVVGDLDNTCAAATNAICALIPEAVSIKGQYGSGQHFFAMLEINDTGVVLDPCSGQFSGAPPIYVGTLCPPYKILENWDNRQIESNCDDEKILSAMRLRGW